MPIKEKKVDFDCESLQFIPRDPSKILPEDIFLPLSQQISLDISNVEECRRLPEAPKFIQIQNFLTTLGILLISIYFLIISYTFYYLFFIIPNIKNFEAAQKLKSDSIGIIGLILLCLILQIAFIYGIQKLKEWILLFCGIFAFIITIICFLVTIIWMDKNAFNGPYDFYFWLTFFTMVPFCFLHLASGIISMNLFTKLIYENTTQNTIRIINPPDYQS